jgi:cytoskeleton protein RodZ
MEGRVDSALGLGERLRSARRARAMSLDQAARALHLEESLLQALEDQRFADVGAPVFVRGHLRSYARLLGLAEDVVLEAYRVADPSSEAAPRIARDREKPLGPSPGPFAVAAGIGVVLFALVALFVGSEPAAPPAAGPASGPGVTAPGLSTVTVPPPASPPASPPAAAAPVPVTRRIEFVFTATSWVQVEAGGERVLDGEFPAGVTRTVEVAPPVDVTLGNAPAVRVVVDGSPYALPPGAQPAGSNVARFRLEAPAPVAVPPVAVAAPGGPPGAPALPAATVPAPATEAPR